MESRKPAKRGEVYKDVTWLDWCRSISKSWINCSTRALYINDKYRYRYNAGYQNRSSHKRRQDGKDDNSHDENDEPCTKITSRKSQSQLD